MCCFVFVDPSLLLSGFASPVENMLDWLQAATQANPAWHLLVVLKGLFLKDLPAAEVARRLFPLVVIAAVMLSTASWFFRRRME